MNSIYNLLTGKPLTEEEKKDAAVLEMLQKQQEENAKHLALDKEESERRLLDSQTAKIDANAALEREKAALEREKSAQKSASARRKREESFNENFANYMESTKKKPRREDNDANQPAPAEVVPPSPLRPTPRKVAARSCSSAKKPAASTKKAVKKSTPPIDFKNKKDILDKATVELVWALEFMEFTRLVQSAWQLGMFEDVSNRRKKKKLGGDVLCAICERLNKDEKHAELYFEDAVDDCGVAKILDEFMTELEEMIKVE